MPARLLSLRCLFRKSSTALARVQNHAGPEQAARWMRPPESLSAFYPFPAIGPLLGVLEHLYRDSVTKPPLPRLGEDAQLWLPSGFNKDLLYS
ncbi:unnamed protein product [Boreogadus saida]